MGAGALGAAGLIVLFRAYPDIPASRDGPRYEEGKERRGIDAIESIADEEQRRNPTYIGPSLRVAAGPGRLRRCGSSPMGFVASTASPRLASSKATPATRLARILG